jgi:hypothetical protein
VKIDSFTMVVLGATLLAAAPSIAMSQPTPTPSDAPGKHQSYPNAGDPKPAAASLPGAHPVAMVSLTKKSEPAAEGRTPAAGQEGDQAGAKPMVRPGSNPE